MRRIFKGKNIRDTEFAAESLINPVLACHLPKTAGKPSNRPTVTEQQQEIEQIDDFSDSKSLK